MALQLRMPYQVLARKYRPQRFSDVIGQEHVTRTLLNALAQGRIAHGYIFSGHRGIGKTTVARILASALNCRNVIGGDLRPTPEPCNQCESCLEIRQGNAVDVIEIDAATNRGIDEIRELRDAARYRPSRDKYKIYILDEAHQITDAAFNALLKTLEEPPEHIVFMMATTQPEDIPQTIRSRCQHYSFHAVRLDDLVAQLRGIAAAENILADDAALALLAEAGDGSVRDALSIMDQAIASAPLERTAGSEIAAPRLDAEQMRSLMGTVSNAAFEQILDAVHRNHSADVLEVLNGLLDAGNSPQPLARQFVRFLRNCTVAKITGLSPQGVEPASGRSPEADALARELLQISEAERERAARSASLFTEEDLTRFLAVMLRTFDELGYRQEPRLHLEVGLLKLVHLQRLLPVEELLSQLGPAPPIPAPRPVAAAPLKGGTSAPPLAKPSPPAAPPPVVNPAVVNPPAVLTQAAQSVPSAPEPKISAAPVASSVVSAGSEEALVGAASGPATFVPGTPTNEEARDPSVASPVPSLAQEMNGTQPAPAAAGPDLASLQATLVAALASTKAQQTAADALHDARLTLHGDTLQVTTGLSKAMLGLVFTATVERILQTSLRSISGAPTRLQLLPGAVSEANGKRKVRPAAVGSAAELAEKHPIVQQARELFSAEISNVIDLREP